MVAKEKPEEKKEAKKKVQNKPEEKPIEKKAHKEQELKKEEPKKEETKEPIKKEEAHAPAIKKEEKIFTIPLRKAFRKAEGKRGPHAIRLVKNFLKTHMKTEDVKLGKHLNEAIWTRGIKKPPRRVRIKAIKEDTVVKAELLGHDYKEFKALPATERKGMKERLMERLGPKAVKKGEEDKALEGGKKPEPAIKPEKQEMVEK